MNSKFNTFKNDISDKSKFEDKIKTMYNTEYEEQFEFILIRKETEFIQTITSNVHILLEDEYSSNIFNNKFLLSLLQKCDRDLLESVKKDKFLLMNAIKNNPKGETLNYSFRKHCNYEESEIVHKCCNEDQPSQDEDEIFCDKFIKCDNNGTLYIICANCNLCYLSSCIKLYCTFCSVEFYTTLDINNTSNINNDVQPATWEKYHCNIIYNDQMPCIQCKTGKLLFDIKKNIVFCPNKTCKFLSEPRNILWRCVVCNKEFASNAKIYNPLEYKMVKKTIKDALLQKIFAFPTSFPCQCELPEYMIHKEGCDGILYMGVLYDRDMVICSKCHSMTFAEKFIWTCKKCNKRFRDGVDIKESMKTISNNNPIDLERIEEENANIFNQSTNESDYKAVSCNSSFQVNDTSSNVNSNGEIHEFSLDNYDIISQIGEGTHCKVFAAKEAEGYNFFALKKESFSSYPNDLINLLKLQNMLAMNDQNITIIKGIFYDKQMKEINILEELALSDLEKELFSLKKTKTFYKEKDIFNILFQIGSACCHLQQNGYVHRNISPSNILLFKGKKYKLSNFSQIRKYNDILNLEKKETYFSDPYINSILNIKNPTAKDFKHIDLIKSDVFILGLVALYLSSLNIQSVIDIHNIWITKKNITEGNEKVGSIIKNTFISCFQEGGDKLRDVLAQMLSFNIKKRFDFITLMKYMNAHVTIDDN